MAPPVSRKRKSEEMEESPRAVTPEGSPARKKMRITQTQKQALIENLQLEITERARQLRAGYALQCADLRARIERRVNRIPIAIRKVTMGELMAQHEAATAESVQPNNNKSSPSKTHALMSQDRPLPALPQHLHQQQQHTSKAPSPVRAQLQGAATRGKKRKSSEIQIASDKENENETMDRLPVAKNSKRVKAATTVTRTASRTGKATSVLSPRSHNSRTLPRSPLKDSAMAAPSSPTKSMIARPVSPLKPASPLKTAASAATSAISASVQGMFEHAKRGTASRLARTASKEKQAATAAKGQMLPPPRPIATASPSRPSPQRTFSHTSTHSATTDVSTASSSTTVVKPKRAGRGAAAAAASKTAEKKSPGAAKRGMARAASAAKTAMKRNNTTANKKVVAEPAATRRVLRKRT
ncbi:hypothetical protein A1O1_05515 [Capronia coronata CBS 617.96]|uniref:Borealin N-terminal domain-containing protein n=1 Tax=Capronia coronata CBS 617.96 TaxID=1182541 RepID=W9YFY8_9EURO|nr:uncharacterized protein A1O1_05515 [Capronia coronata CBS 617.96]EXJ88585.1 hypothetical protein A1O1_05515 [Capronia coronata CBS 617.96]